MTPKQWNEINRPTVFVSNLLMVKTTETQTMFATNCDMGKIIVNIMLHSTHYYFCAERTNFVLNHTAHTNLKYCIQLFVEEMFCQCRKLKTKHRHPKTPEKFMSANISFQINCIQMQRL